MKSSNTKREGGVSLARVLPGLVLAAGLLLAFAIRLHRLDMPLERDEGEYAYAGQLILEGVPPYAEVDNVKLPGTYYAYALLLSLFGRSAAGIHLGLAIWTTASALALFFVGRSLFGPLAGASAAAALALLGVSEAVLGLAAHATHFVVLPTAIGCLLLLRRGPPRGRAALAAGVALGLAFLMKQQAVPLVAFGAAFVVWRGRAGGPRRWIGGLCAYATGAALPYLVFCLYAWRKGVFESFWFWTVEYAGTYVSMVSPWSAPAFLWDALLDVTRWNLPLWLLAGAGAVLLFRRPFPRDTRVFTGGLAIASFLAVCPGLYFREHYFIVLLPAVALLAAVGLADGPGSLGARSRGVWLSLYAAASLLAIAGQRDVFFSLSSAGVTRAVYGTNPFLESVEVAKYVRDRSSPGDRIAVMGSEPEIYFYSERRSAARYPYLYALLEGHPLARRMQDDMIREIDAARPKWLIVVRVPQSWLIRPDSDRTILTWTAAYLGAHYAVEGIVEIHGDRPSTYRFGPSAVTSPPEGSTYILVCRRSD